MLIKFYNDFGSVVFGGKSTDSAPFKLTGADGLSLPQKTFTRVKYASSDGQLTSDVTVNARTITLAGDICKKNGGIAEYRRLLKILDNEGTLCIYGGANRKIKAVCSDFARGSDKNGYLTYVIQFKCDNPYFEDFLPVKRYIYKRTDNIDQGFKLPGVFTKRASKGDINYSGTAASYPKIIVKSGGDGVLAASENECMLEIRNNTSGKFIKLNRLPSSGEYLTADVENRKIYGSNGENLLKYISDDTYLDEFKLCPGKNEIEVITNAGSVTVLCEFTNKYTEAVF